MPVIVMDNLVVLMVKSFVITICLLLCMRPLSFSVGLVDNPGGRKKHCNSVPLVGGLAIFLGFSVLSAPLMLSNKVYGVFWCACLALIIISAIDDRFHLRATHRFMMHSAVIMLMAWFGGTAIDRLGDLFGLGIICLGWGSWCFTAFAVVGIINAVNMMDGVDGLTAGVSLVELGLLLSLAVQSHLTTEVMLILTFMGTLLGFSLFNYPLKFNEKYKVFLGDAGSTLLGLVLAWLCIRLTQRPHGYPPALMLWLVALPLMDTLHLMINRKFRGVPVFKADRRHIHHICLQLNGSPRQITRLLSTVALMIGFLGIFLYQRGGSDSLLFYGIAVLFAVYTLIMHFLKKLVLQRKRELKRLRSIGV